MPLGEVEEERAAESVSVTILKALALAASRLALALGAVAFGTVVGLPLEKKEGVALGGRSALPSKALPVGAKSVEGVGGGVGAEQPVGVAQGVGVEEAWEGRVLEKEEGGRGEGAGEEEAE